MVEVPPPPPPSPPKIENKPLSAGSSTDKEAFDYAIWVNMKLSAEKEKAEAEYFVEASRQEMKKLIDEGNRQAAEIRQQAEAEAEAVRAGAEAERAEAERLKAEAAAFKAETEAQRSGVLADAADEVARIKEEARQEGREAGLTEGRAQGYREGNEKAFAEQKQAIIDANAKAEKTLQDAEAEKDRYVQQAEKEITDIALKIADKILPQHFIDAPQIILPLVRKALQKLKDQPRIAVHVAPEHYDMVLLAKNELQAVLEGNASFEIISDETLVPGDVVLESPNGNLDARLETQLAQIKKAVQDVML